MPDIKMVVTDLDGTLLQNDQSISAEDFETLNWLGKNKICRVAATGRNLFKVRMVLTPSSPFDYVICSSGAGIIDWKTQKIISAINLSNQLTSRLINYLIQQNQNFKVSDCFPDNHNFSWWQSYECPEISRYVQHHKVMGKAQLLIPEKEYCSSQFLLFFPKISPDFEQVRSMIQKQFPDVSIIRTTSPLNEDWLWMEVFPKDISKAHGIQQICRIEGITQDQTFSIGNDFNDLEMLDFTSLSYVVHNAPDELKEKFLISLAFNENGFSHAVKKHVKM